MPLDALCLSAVREELTAQITGMKIDKVQQPERDLIILNLRGSGGTCKLLISAGPADTRAHLTEHQFENPASPPMFCMLLRKHLSGARIISMTQPPAERILEIKLSAPDAMGVHSEKSLILELFGRLPNIILTEGGMIIDCLRRIGGELEDKRMTLPGLLYRPPPQQEGKKDPLNISENEWQSAFANAPGTAADKWLLSSFSALSPLICRELSWRAYGETDSRIENIKDSGAALKREFFKLTNAANRGAYEPWTLTGADGTPRDFSFTRIMQYETALDAVRAPSFSAMLENYYTRTAQNERARQRASAMQKTVKTARDRLVRKLASQKEELKKTAERENLRESGDIISANMHLMEKGQSRLTAQDFYSETGAMRDIPLDPQKTPQQNAAKYYKEYTKAKNAEKHLSEQISAGENELIYLESVLHEIELAEGDRGMAEIRAELEQTGYVKPRKNKQNKQKQTKEKNTGQPPMRFTSSTGMQILAGRNNTQNEILTLKTAAKTDIWLHAQKTHGAHVIITCNGKEPDETTLQEAAAIAAYHSQTHPGGKVPVDYAPVKQVKKPPGSRPGMVIYTDYKTIVAVADEKLVKELRVKGEG